VKWGPRCHPDTIPCDPNTQHEIRAATQSESRTPACSTPVCVCVCQCPYRSEGGPRPEPGPSGPKHRPQGPLWTTQRCHISSRGHWDSNRWPPTRGPRAPPGVASEIQGFFRLLSSVFCCKILNSFIKMSECRGQFAFCNLKPREEDVSLLFFFKSLTDRRFVQSPSENSLSNKHRTFTHGRCSCPESKHWLVS